MQKKIIVTSALPYSNGDLHVGHLLEYLQSDSWVRFRKMQGEECLFFCADDTHGTPVMIAAKERGISPEEMIAAQRKQHLAEFTDFGIAFTHYSYTHSPYNKELCLAFYAAMREGKHLSQKTVSQSYCESCKMFLPDRFIRGTCPQCKTPDQYGDVCESCGSTYNPEDLLDAACSICQNPPVLKESTHLFFELEPMNAMLRAWVKEHTSKEVGNHLKKWFEEGLKAWNISRDAPYFGFEIPDMPDKYFYVWVDAPIGYIASSAEWGAQQKIHPPFQEEWKNPENDIVHFIGKDILYFHALFWPAMLHTAGYALPKKLFVHGFLTLNGKKMSKSKKRFILARTYLESGIPPDCLRYYFLSKISGAIEDVDLSLDDFKTRINTELIGKITNLASRSITMLHKRNGGKLTACTTEGAALLEKSRAAATEISKFYMEAQFNLAIIRVRELAEAANQYFDHAAPWKLGKSDTEAHTAAQIATDVIQLFRQIVIFLTPALPAYSDRVRTLLNEKELNTKSRSQSELEAESHPYYLWADLQTHLPEDHPILPYTHLASRLTDEQIASLLS